MADLVKKIRTSSGDLQIDYNALANLPTISNPNLIINGDFQVWQRGERFENYENAYCADRWNIRNAKNVTHLIEKSTIVPENCNIQNSIHITENYDSNTYLQYHFESSLTGTYTLSFWYKSTAVFNSYIVDNGSFVHLGTNFETGVWKKVVYTFTASLLSRINLIHTMGIGDCYITGVKLEAGNTATQFVSRIYAEELMMCRRYFDVISGVRVSGGEKHSSINCYIYNITKDIRYMAKTPTISAHGITTANSPEGIFVRSSDLEMIPGFTFSYACSTGAIAITAGATSASSIQRPVYDTQLYMSDAFKLYLDAEIY